MYSSWYEYLYYYWWYHQQQINYGPDLERGPEPMEIETPSFELLQEIKQELYSISEKINAVSYKLNRF